MPNFVDLLERQELVQKLVESGYAELVEALLYNDGADSSDAKVYTKKGRLNKSGACRVLGWKTKTLEDALAECRKILGGDMFN